uniref:Uncharacterized protein n=1 Tax=Romanomermis culicivorax TaxID=13658 RepID=A0A915HRM3_ROMCU
MGHLHILVAKKRSEKPKTVSSDVDTDDDELSEEQKERKRQFELKRKKHYNEFQAVKLAKQLLAQQDETVDDDDVGGGDGGQSSSTSSSMPCCSQIVVISEDDSTQITTIADGDHQNRSLSSPLINPEGDSSQTSSQTPMDFSSSGGEGYNNDDPSVSRNLQEISTIVTG